MPKLGMEPVRREQIRRAAARLIADRGFDGTTLRHVAQAARVSTGMINHYYPNKIALLMDALIAASEWFQGEIRHAVAPAGSGADRFGTLVRVGVFNDSREAAAGRRIWAWALAESTKSEELMRIIQERRRLFQEIIADVLRQLDADAAIGDEAIRELAAECDAYFNGLAIHLATGAMNLDADAATSSLLAMVTARLRGEDGERSRRSPGHGVRPSMDAPVLPVAGRPRRRGGAGKAGRM